MPTPTFDPLKEGAIPDESGFDPLKEGAVPDTPSNAGFVPEAKKSLLEMGKGVLSMFNPIPYLEGDKADSGDSYIEQYLGRKFNDNFRASTPPQRIAEGMVNTIGQGAKDVASGISDIAGGASSIRSSLLNRMNAGPYSTYIRDSGTPATEQVKSGLQNVARGALAVPEATTGMPTTETFDALKEGNYGRAAGFGLGGAALGYGFNRLHSQEVPRSKPTFDKIELPDENQAPVTTGRGGGQPKPRFTWLPAEGLFSDSAGNYYNEQLQPVDINGNPVKGGTSPLAAKTTPAVQDRGKVPAFYTGTGEYIPAFQNDVDKAMWMVGSLQPGPRYTRYLKYLMDQGQFEKPEQAVNVSKAFTGQVRDFMRKQEPGEIPIPEEPKAEQMQVPNLPKISRQGVAQFPQAGKRQLYDIAEQIRNNINNEDLVSNLMNKAETLIENETDPAIIEDHLRQMQGYQDYAKAHGTPDEIELMGSLHDTALDKYRSSQSEPQRMQVPGTSNVAVGGAEERGLRIMSSNLYKGDMPYTVAKELVQNASDEMKTAGVKSPIKVNTGEAVLPNEQNSFDSEFNTPVKRPFVSVSDNGRGLGPDKIYTVFTNLFESGKEGEVSASGGFGIAKAAPLLSGDYVDIVSVVDEKVGDGKRRVQYSFRGNPDELMNQKKGVPLTKSYVSASTPTGMKITTYFPEGTDIAGAEYYARSAARNSTGLPFEVHLNGRTAGFEAHPSKISGTIPIPGGGTMDIALGDAGRTEHGSYDIHLLNNGLYQKSINANYGEQLPNMPWDIYVNVKSEIPETSKQYPFISNRESLKDNVQGLVNKWIKDNVVGGAINARSERLQKAYDSMFVIPNPAPHGVDTYMYDQGNRFTREELLHLGNDPTMQDIAQSLHHINSNLMTHVDNNLNWSVNPLSAKMEKFGFLAAVPDSQSGNTTLGIHIPNPASSGAKSAILVNLFEHLKRAMNTSDPVDNLSTGLYTTMTHEIAHIPGGGHDQAFAYRHAALLESLGGKKTTEYLNAIANTFGDTNGQLKPEISKLLDIYDESRKRDASSKDSLLGTGINQEGRPPIPPNQRFNGGGNFNGPEKPSGPSNKQPSWKREAYELGRGITAAWDLSAPFRQGIGLIGTKQWFDAYAPMVKSFGSEAAFEASQKAIEQLPTVRNGIAYKSGLALTDLSKNLTNREEILRSTWAEKVPLVRASNRAYTAYLNNLRAYSFDKLYNMADDEFKQDPAKVRELAQYINDATGRGKYEFGVSNTGMKLNAEKYAPFLNDVFFSSRLMSSRMRMLNPGTYIMLDPFVRQQYLKSLVKMGVAWYTFNQLGKMMGGETTDDPNNTDFGKIKFGNTRIDPAGGFQQYIVLASRLASGQFTSSTTGRESNLGQGYKAYTRKDVLEQFASNKLHPTIRFAYDLADASGYKPFNVADRTMQMYVPMVMGDLAQIMRDDPRLLPIMAPSILGMGAQTYDKNAGKQGVYISPDTNEFPYTGDVQFKGGPLQ